MSAFPPPAAPAPHESLLPAEILAAQMRRDRDRLAASEMMIAVLQEQQRRLERTPPQRALRQLQSAYRRLPVSLRAAVRRLRGGVPGAAQAPGAAAVAVVPPASRGQALVIDDHWPQPDRDAGSVEIVNLVRALMALGFDVVLAAARDHAGAHPARLALERDGIRCLRPADAASVEDYLAQRGSCLDLCVLCRVYCGGRFLEAALRDARRSRILFNTIDLNYLREERRARLQQDEAALAIAAQVRIREEQLIRASDATLVVSRAELELLAQTVPEALVAELPLARPLSPPATPFAGRSGIGFIGGFAHAPNVDAVRYFLDEIWPLVLRRLPELELTIVGPDFPVGLLHGVPGRVRALGQLPEIGPWLEGLRLTVAPLRFGSGAKGKVASSLAAGVPCIVTPVAAEGMLLDGGAGVLVGDTPEAFAARLCEAYADEALWRGLSASGLAHAAAHLSPEAWRARLDRLLLQIGL